MPLVSEEPRFWANMTIGSPSLSAPAKLKTERHGFGTIATTGAVELILTVPCTGVLSEATFAGKDALAANDTNFLTFAIVNKGQAGAGTTQMLASSPAGVNTTKVTGGAAVAAYTFYPLTLHATAANLNIVKNDVLSITITATGTLANTITLSQMRLGFIPST
jgi:hypothetical protein